jgi:nucleoside-diphosphate-sugar epimerase
MEQDSMIVGLDDLILITGANGFLGSKLVETAIARGFRNVRCFVGPSNRLTRLEAVIKASGHANVEFVQGNLLSRDSCARAAKGVSVVLHAAAGIEKSFPGSYMNSVVATRNLLEAVLASGTLKRFVNVSSFAVYSNTMVKAGRVLDEGCETERRFMQRFDAYCFSKTKQDELVMEYGAKRQLPYVIVRPGVLYGPGAKAPIHSRVGIGTFGFFMHIGGSNTIPLAYIDNAADAIVQAGITSGINGEIFNLLDDDLPTSRTFLRLYKRNVKRFKSVFVPYPVFYAFSYLWERYSVASNRQLPPVFNTLKCSAEWKRMRYTNAKIKKRLGWTPKVSTRVGLERHFAHCRKLEEVNA